MAGEKSKTSGEIGEKIAGGLLHRIGWAVSLKNIPIPCNTRAHVNERGNQRTSHGEDRVFFYNNPFHDARTDIVHVSVKNKLGAYPTSEASLRREFKEHLAELHEIMECAIYSQEVAEALTDFKGRKNTFHSGLLIWVHNDSSNIDRDIKPVLSKMRLEQESDIPVYLIDAGRASFLLKILDDVKMRCESWSFYFPSIGTALTVDESRTRAFLPLEIIASDVVPILTREGERSELLIYANQAFDGNSYKKLMAYGLKFSLGLVSTIKIGMPDYNAATDAPEAERARLAFSERDEKIEPFSFNRSILSLLEEN